MQFNRQYSTKHARGFLLLWLCIIISLIMLSACSGAQGNGQSTLLPTEYLPTVIAMTLEADQAAQVSQSDQIHPSGQNSAEPEINTTQTLAPTEPKATSTLLPADTPAHPTLTPYTLPAPVTATLATAIPNAEIEIREPGPLSIVASPLHVYSYLRTGSDGRVRIELLGEDKRLLYREIRVVTYAPAGGWAIFLADLDFEITAAAEVGRLQISVDDEFGRTIALNSVPLILLSIGDADILPPPDALAPIVIQQPTKKALVQGGTVLISGLARSSSDQPLLVELIAPDGAVVGQRLVEIQTPAEGEHGTFAIEIPYKVASMTNVRVTVTEGEASLNDTIHLTSVEVRLSP